MEKVVPATSSYRKDDPEEKMQATARMQAVNEAYEALMKRNQFRDPDEDNYYSDDSGDDDEEWETDDDDEDGHPFGRGKIFFSFGPNGLTFTYGGQTFYAGGPGGRGGLEDRLVVHTVILKL